MTTPMTRQVNDEGVDAAALARAIELWLVRRADRTATKLAQHSGVHARGIWQIRRCTRPTVSLDWADRLTLAMDIPLEEVAPVDDDRHATIGRGVHLSASMSPSRVRRPGAGCQR